MSSGLSGAGTDWTFTTQKAVCLAPHLSLSVHTHPLLLLYGVWLTEVLPRKCLG